jgi:subfamily B ATP-binding cassette protein MsbA
MNKKSIPALLNYIKPYRIRFFQAALSMTVLAALRGLIVYILGPIIDGVFVQKNAQLLILLVVVLPFIFMLRMVCEYVNAYLMSWIGQKAVQCIRDDLFTHIHKLSMEFYWRKRSSEVIARVINDLNNVQSAIHFVPLNLIRDIFTMFSVLFVLFYLNWKFALISIAILPVAVLILKVLGRKMSRSSMESQQIVEEISHKLQESLQGIAIVKAFNFEEEAIKRFKKTNDEFFAKMMRYLRATAMSPAVMELVGSLMLTMMIYLGGREIFHGSMTTGTFFSFVAGFFTAYLPLKNIANLNSRIQLGLASWERIYQLFEEKPAVITVTSPKKPERFHGHIEFKNVSYMYPSREHLVLKNMSFEIKPGQVAAFVGPSGSGKTTIIHLLLRFFDPTDGEIYIDGINLREIDVQALRKNMGLVTQDTILFDDTIFRNITMGKPDATMQEVSESAVASDSIEFISSMPRVYDTVLGERGIKLSGGQRQRLAIARAVIKKPGILLLDEATSNLDTTSEKIVQTAIEKILHSRTVVMVAHRLSTVKNADKIFVLRKSEIVETGTHEELLLQNGIYRKLYEVQV